MKAHTVSIIKESARLSPVVLGSIYLINEPWEPINSILLVLLGATIYILVKKHLQFANKLRRLSAILIVAYLPLLVRAISPFGLDVTDFLISISLIITIPLGLYLMIRSFNRRVRFKRTQDAEIDPSGVETISIRQYLIYLAKTAIIALIAYLWILAYAF